MQRYAHLSHQALLSRTASALTTRCFNTAEILGCLAEVEERELHVAAGYDSMFSYCVHFFGMSEGSARKFIRATRAVREFPAILEMVESGRLHLSAVVTLAPHLKPGTAEDLLAAACGKTRTQIEQLLAERFPKPDVPARIESLDAQASLCDNAPRGALSEGGPEPEQIPAPRPRVKPLAPERYSVQFTIDKETYERLRHAEALLSHQVRAGDFAEVYDRALRFFVPHLERGKFGATDRPRQQQRASKDPRYIPAHVKRAVWERDGEQCTFVSDAGHRCEARTHLEFDHIEEVARGGRSTVSNVRLRCRAHNQYTAGQTFGEGFMEMKRREAQERRARAEAEKQARAAEKEARAKAAEEARVAAAAAEQAARAAEERAQEIIPFLRKLGFRADEAKRAASQCEDIADAPLETRFRRALSILAPAARRDAPSVGAS